MILRVLVTVYAAIALAIQLVEDSKDGLTPAEAKAAAMAHVKELVIGAFGSFPVWLPEFIIGYVIDMLVNVLNSKGVFEHKTGEPAPSPASVLGSYQNLP
jgi:hypothetical protein